MAESLESNPEIERFVKSWRDISSVYEKLAEEVRERCEEGLRGIKCIISYRAKSTKSLEQSIKRRQRVRINEGKGPYQSQEEIKDDMVDLAGVRIALYFPDDSRLVEEFICAEFENARPAVVWGVDKSGGVVTQDVGRRFVGYRATHFRVRLKENSSYKRPREELLGRTAEIQVTSVVMHAWADVHHDLIYKPYSGELSEDEKRILDLINGLAHAGEVALQQLQALLSRRMSQLDRSFADQHELAMWLKAHITTRYMDPFTEHPPRMEMLKLLLDVLRVLNLDTPRQLQLCLETLQKIPQSSVAPPISTIIIMLQRMDPLLNEWTGPHGADLTCWALLQVCAWNTTTQNEGAFIDARRKAFIMLNAVNIAISLGCARNDFGDRIHSSRAAVRPSDWILPLILARGYLPMENSEVIEEVQELWSDYLAELRSLEAAPTDVFSTPYDSRLLWLLSCALSGLGIVALPRASGEVCDASKAFMWPGVLGWPSKELEVTHGRPAWLYNSGLHRTRSAGHSYPTSDFITDNAAIRNSNQSDSGVFPSTRSPSLVGPLVPPITKPQSPHPTLSRQTTSSLYHSNTFPPKYDVSECVFVLQANGSWLNIETKNLTRETSWTYCKVSFEDIMKGSQWISIKRSNSQLISSLSNHQDEDKDKDEQYAPPKKREGKRTEPPKSSDSQTAKVEEKAPNVETAQQTVHQTRPQQELLDHPQNQQTRSQVQKRQPQASTENLETKDAVHSAEKPKVSIPIKRSSTNSEIDDTKREKKRRKKNGRRRNKVEATKTTPDPRGSRKVR